MARKKRKKTVVSDTCPKCHCRYNRAGECLLCPPNRRVPKAAATTGSWPIEAGLSLGVFPEQVPEAMETAKRLGVPTDFTKDGAPIMTSPMHFKKYARTRHNGVSNYFHQGYE